MIIDNSILDKLTNDIIMYYIMFKENDKNPTDYKLNINEFKKIFEKNKKNLAIKIFQTINVDNNEIDIYEFLTFMLYDDYLRPIEKINEIPENNEEKLEDFDSFKIKHSNNNLESQKEKYKKYLSERQQKFKRLLTLVLLEEKRTKLKIIRILKLKDKKNFDYFKKTFEETFKENNKNPTNYIPSVSSTTPSYMKNTRKLKSARTPTASSTAARSSARTAARSVSRPPQAPPLTARTSTAKNFFTKEMGKKIKLRVEKKIELVKKFNQNLKEFQQDYEVIKEIIKINSIGHGIFFTNINSPKTITSKLNEIIKKKDNNCEKLINQSNIKNLNNDDDLDESIKIFILLCYYINKINCILNKFDDVLKKDYKSNKRFNSINNIEYLQIILKKIIKQRNNINKKNEKINSELKINDEEMNKICENIKSILNKIKEIFIGIHDDLKIELIEEIIPENEFKPLLRNTAATTIEGTNKNAYETLKRNISSYKELSREITNINTLIDNLNVEEYSEVELDNNNIKNYVKFYRLLKEQEFEIPPTSRGIRTERRDTSKQKILRSIVNLIVTNYEKISYPEYKFLDADKIYEKKSN